MEKSFMQDNNPGPSLASTGTRPFKLVYTITENKNGKSFWTRIGAAFTNRDGSLTLKLDCIPIGGTMQVRDYEPREGDRDARSNGTPFGASPTVASAGF
ncbi:MAG: hypothetical protein ACRELY_03005 [Polyangiaceae bacterium]